MDRRRFLSLALLAAAGSMTLDFDRLLWVPKPMIVVPAMPREIWHIASVTPNGAGWESLVGRPVYVGRTTTGLVLEFSR